MILGFLNNVEYADAICLSSNEAERLTAISLSKINISIGITYTIGEVIGFAMCMMASYSVRGSYINSIIALIVLVLLGLTIGTGWEILKNIFLLPGSLFSGALYYWVNGLMLVLIGILCIIWTKKFYLIKTDNFSDKTALRLT